MPTSWPDNPKVIGGRHIRLDGMAKASGKAKYPSDVHPEGLLFGALLYSPHPHAKIKAIDLEPAKQMPGVKAVVLLPSIKAGQHRPVRRRHDRRRRGRDRGAGLRRRAGDQGRIRGPAPRRHRGAGRLHRRAADRQGQRHHAEHAEGPQPGQRQPRGSPGEGRRRDRGDLHGAGHHARLPRAARPDRAVEARLGRGVGEHAGRRRHRRRAGGPHGPAAVEGDGPHRGHGRRLRLEVRRRRVGPRRGRPLEGGRRTPRPDVPRPRPRAHDGRQPAERERQGEDRRDEGRQDRRPDRRDQRHGRRRRGANFPFPYVYGIPASSRSHSDVFVNGGNARAMRARGIPRRAS